MDLKNTLIEENVANIGGGVRNIGSNSNIRDNSAI